MWQIIDWRSFYNNIKKVINFIFTTSLGEIILLFIGLLLGIDITLLIIQLLWINLTIYLFSRFMLGKEEKERRK